jgi:hypothetical protein
MLESSSSVGPSSNTTHVPWDNNVLGGSSVGGSITHNGPQGLSSSCN